MEIEKHASVSDPVVRSGYDFYFEYGGLVFRAGGSSMTGFEYVYVNDQLVSSTRSRSELSVHELVLVPALWDGTVVWDECAEGTVPKRSRHFKCGGHKCGGHK